MISKKRWLALVAIIGVVPAVALSILNSFVPGARDLADPLGNPAAYSLELIDSADQLDQLTQGLVTKHTELASGMQVLIPLSDNLSALADTASNLTAKTESLNASTTTVAGNGTPLPGLISDITALSDQASPTVVGLSGAVGTVAGELEAVDSGLGAISDSVIQLGPRAAAISSTLAIIEEEARHVQEFGPLLAILGPLVNGPQQPAPPVPAPGN